jgi:preprotein translocase subunit SecE
MDEIKEKVKVTVQKIVQFLKEAKLELKKVTWPTPKQTLASTAVVIVLVFIVSFILGIIDFALAKAVKFILG